MLTNEGPSTPSLFRTVLLVDDEPSFLKMMGRLLAGRSNILVRQARSAIAARTILTSEPVHLVCSDYELGAPQTGIDLLAEVGEKWPLTHRVLMTGHARLEWVTELPYLVIAKGVASPMAVRDLLVLLARAP